jgi:hypothetical protein
MNNKIIVAGFLSLLSVVAHANIKYMGVDLGQGQAVDYNGTPMNVFAGKLNFLNLNTNVNFKTVCGDLGNVISNGQQWNCVPLQASSVSANMGAAGRIVAGAFYLPTNNEQAAALQLAVWEAVYDAGTNAGTADFTTGVFKTNISSNLLTLANTYYSYVNTPGEAIYFQPNPLNAGQGQLAPVPEPATMLTLGAGLLIAARRRRKSA